MYFLNPFLGKKNNILKLKVAKQWKTQENKSFCLVRHLRTIEVVNSGNGKPCNRS